MRDRAATCRDTLGVTDPRTVDRLRELVDRSVDPPVGDGWLVERFASAREPEAFAELVRRHGPLVMGPELYPQ